MTIVSISREVSIKEFQAYARCQGENASQVAEIVNGVYGVDTVTANYVQFWFRRFRSGIFDVKDAPRTGRLVVENVDKITEIIEVDRHASSSSIWPFRLSCEEVLGPVDPRDIIYTTTRLRTPSTDQSSRKPPHRKKCPSTANCFIGHIQAQIALSLGAHVSSRTIRKRLAEEHLGLRCLLRVLPLTPTHRRLRLEWCHAG
ncbi:histone-lysine N-methyltransferase SETMAR [Trichonephila clavipes]|nr:histone-lysine N-methyltransferase SETMAR [Trichonephila clavipes]